MGHQLTIAFLEHKLRGLAWQHNKGASQVIFKFPEGRLDLTGLMIQCCQIIGWGARQIRNCRDQSVDVVGLRDAPEAVFHDAHRNAVDAFPPVLGAGVTSAQVTAILQSLFQRQHRIFFTRQSRSAPVLRALFHNAKLKKLRSAKQYLDKLPNNGY